MGHMEQGVATEAEEALPRYWQLSEADVQLIAERAANLAVAKITANFYKSVGKSVVEKAFTIIGICTIGGYFFLKAKGVVE